MTADTFLLAIDTTTDQSGVALFDGACLDEVSWTSCHEQTVNLLSEIDHQLTRWGREISSVGAVGVATGPGRFNALRVGMSVAKGLVLSYGVSIIGVGSLEAVAWPYLMNHLDVVSVVAAGRGRVVWQAFRLDDGMPSGSAEPVNAAFEELIETLQSSPSRRVVTGELTPEQVVALREIDGIAVPAMSGRLGRAGSVAELAYRRVREGFEDDPVTLEPHYVHGRRARRVSS